MSSSRKMLKLVSIVAAITGLAMWTFGLAIAGAGLFGGTAISGTDAAPLYMGVSGVSGLCFVVMGLMGMRASNVPSRSGTSIATAFGSLAVSAVAVLFEDRRRQRRAACRRRARGSGHSVLRPQGEEGARDLALKARH